MRFIGPLQTGWCLQGFLISYSFSCPTAIDVMILTSCKIYVSSLSQEPQELRTREITLVHVVTFREMKGAWECGILQYFVLNWNTVKCVSFHRDLQGNGYSLYTMDDKHCYCGNLDPAQLAGTFQCLQCRKRFHAGDWGWLTDWLTEHRDLDLDARYNYCDTLTGPNLGYIVSGQGGSIRCFRGSERFVLTPSLPQPVKFRAEWCTDAPENCIFSTFSDMCFDQNCFTWQCEKKTDTVQGFKFCTFIGRLQVASW